MFILFVGFFFTCHAYDKTYAVIIGVADYKNFTKDDGDLKYTINDAMKFYKFLMSERGGSVPKENIVLLLNADATKANIIEKSKALFANAKSKDRIFFYFSGHGSDDCFMPYDVTVRGNNLLYFSDVKEIFRCAKCSTKLLIADACFSGTMKNSIKKQKTDENAQSDDSVNIAVMMSCGKDETSLELGNLKQGVFTYYLIEGLGGAAYNAEKGSKYITIGELFNYVYKNVTAKAKEYHGKQTPVLFGKFDKRLIIANVDVEAYQKSIIEAKEKKTNIVLIVSIYVGVTVAVVLLILFIKRKTKKHENL